jgi:hypothetical protein
VEVQQAKPFIYDTESGHALALLEEFDRGKLNSRLQHSTPFAGADITFIAGAETQIVWAKESQVSALRREIGTTLTLRSD